ncbi:MAG TPA: histidinol dehydrogenase [Firmicutes bacterium]|nr:histidinol dehydrogenase [Bacillota bacterium]
MVASNVTGKAGEAGGPLVRVWRTEELGERPEREVRRLLRRGFGSEVSDGPGAGGVEVAPEVMARTLAIFGEPLSPLQAVERIVRDVARRGDEAVVEWTWRIDGVKLEPEDFWLGPADFEKAFQSLDLATRDDLEMAAERIRRFHRAALPKGFFLQDEAGNVMGQRFVPLERVAAYVPGGRAPLFSTLLMTVVPARIAGVDEVIVATPPGPGGEVHPAVLAAARLAGASRLLRVGGAQAIAALAYGTASIPAVDKIVGPGNLFVTLAKRLVFGAVGIDMLAGPSEVVVVAEKLAGTDPAHLAADLLSQAEHDPDAACILVADDVELAKQVLHELEEQVETLPRAPVAREALTRHGCVFVVRNLEEAARIVNAIAPEHLELQLKDPWAFLSQVRHAGAIFLGPHSCEPLGDYLAGPNHVLPTGGAARYASMLGVEDFLRRSSVLQVSEEGLLEIGGTAVRLARMEGLEAHARSVARRLGEDETGEGKA